MEISKANRKLTAKYKSVSLYLTVPKTCCTSTLNWMKTEAKSCSPEEGYLPKLSRVFIKMRSSSCLLVSRRAILSSYRSWTQESFLCFPSSHTSQKWSRVSQRLGSLLSVSSPVMFSFYLGWDLMTLQATAVTPSWFPRLLSYLSVSIHLLMTKVIKKKYTNLKISIRDV